jgi:hypothetical protein
MRFAEGRKDLGAKPSRNRRRLGNQATLADTSGTYNADQASVATDRPVQHSSQCAHFPLTSHQSGCVAAGEFMMVRHRQKAVRWHRLRCAFEVHHLRLGKGRNVCDNPRSGV